MGVGLWVMTPPATAAGSGCVGHNLPGVVRLQAVQGST